MLVRYLFQTPNTQSATGPSGLGAFAALPITWSTTTPTGTDLATYPIEDAWETWVKNFAVLDELEFTLEYENSTQGFDITDQLIRNYPNTSLDELDIVTLDKREWYFTQVFPGIPGPNPLDEVNFDITVRVFNGTPKARFPSLTSFWPSIEISGSFAVQSGSEYAHSFSIADSATGITVDFLGNSIPLDVVSDPGFEPTVFNLTISARSWFSHGGKWNTTTGALN